MTQNEDRSVFQYEILSIQLTGKYLAVYAEKVDGGHRRFAMPIDGLAVCAVTEKRMRGVGFECKMLWEKKRANEVCGFELTDCGFCACNECGNFCGLALGGDDLSEVDYCLNLSEYGEYLGTSEVEQANRKEDQGSDAMSGNSEEPVAPHE